MAQEDTLTLAARIKDQFSGPVREMSKVWHEFQDKLKHGNEEGSKGAKEHAKEVGELREKFKEMRREVMEGVTPALEELGIGMFSVGGSIAAIVSSLKGAAEQFNVFKDASIRAGSSVDFLQSASATIANLTGESTGQAVQNLADVNEQLQRITRGRPDTIDAWKSAYAGLWETLGQELKGKTVPQALETVMAWKDAHPEIAIDKVRDVFRLLGLDQRLATVSLKEFREEQEKNDKWQKEHPYDSETIRKLDEAFHDLGRTINGVGWEITHAFGADGAETIKSFSALLSDMVAAAKQAIVILTWKPGEGLDVLKQRLLGAQGDTKSQSWFDFRMNTPEENRKIWGATPGTTLAPGQTRPDAFGSLTEAQKLAAGMRPIGFTTGGDAENVFTRSIHVGTLAALQDWYAALSGKHDGIMPASYGPSGSAGGGRNWGGGGYSVLDQGGTSGNLPGGGPKPMPGGADNSAGGGGAGDGGRVAGSWDRSRFAKELADNPALRERLKRISTAEDSPGTASGTLANQAIMETMMNRAAVRHTSLAEQLRLVGEGHGYYPTMRGYNARQNTILDENLAKVLAGSNVSGNATDNSSSRLAEKEKRTGAFRWIKDINRESFFAPGTADRRQAAEWDRLQRRDLLANAAAAGIGSVHKVEGDAHLRVDLNGFPKGTRTDLTYGGLFTQYTLSRGMQMEESEQQ